MDLSLAAFAGAALCIGLGAVGSALGEGLTAGRAAEAIARQPQAAPTILRTMLVGQAVAESASIFALVVALLLLFGPDSGPLLRGVALFSAGLCMGAGAFGPGYGSGLPSAAACTAVGRNPARAARITTTMLVSQAVAQTPSIFALLVAFLLMFRSQPPEFTLSGAAALLGAAIAAGVSATGPGIGAGFAGAAACDGTARRPDRAPLILRTMLVGQAVSQSTSVYGLVVALVLLYVV
ncbi:ATP synthase F0 subunit C [Deferrisoma camini]|uniref:ATP synthase F0 subunit C n=1 Tax=Deferrisoma camini TaxID=1035120 RepID=UPI00046D1827|nr:ATP synthase F0 subunit C [Deferrisoma camini]